MDQFFNEEGISPVTLIGAGPCFITQLKKKEKDGYEAVQIGYEKLKSQRIRKTMKGKEFRYLREFKDEIKNYKVGQEISIAIFQKGDKVKVSGFSKGKGFQGAVKRWGFTGRNATHGVKHEHRTLGSVGGAYPQHVMKGKKMPGRMGGERTSVKNLEIVWINKAENLLALKGAVPGRKGTLLEIQTRE